MSAKLCVAYMNASQLIAPLAGVARKVSWLRNEAHFARAAITRRKMQRCLIATQTLDEVVTHALIWVILR